MEHMPKLKIVFKNGDDIVHLFFSYNGIDYTEFEPCERNNLAPYLIGILNQGTVILERG